MPRVFLGLAIGNVLVVAATAFLGLLGSAGLRNHHIAIAIFALILTCLVQVLAFTYFTVTFKLMGQAVHIGKSALDPLQQAKRLKLQMTRCLGLVVGAVLVATASGASSWREGAGAAMHLVTGLVLPILVTYVLSIEYSLIARNTVLVGAVMHHFESQKNAPTHPHRKLG